MITHVAAFRWKDTVTEAQVAELTDAFRGLRERVPALVSYRFGADLGLHQANADYAVVAVLRDEEGVSAYLSDPAHVEIVKRYTKPMTATRTAVQFFSPPDTEVTD
jgi:hypothetical protein